MGTDPDLMKKGLRLVAELVVIWVKGTDPDLMKKGLRPDDWCQPFNAAANGPRPYEEGIKTSFDQGDQCRFEERTQTL